MNGSEIISAFKIYYDRVASFSAPGYTDSEILLFLNNAQDELIKSRVFGDNFQPPAFEDNEKRVADLFPITGLHTDYTIDHTEKYGNSWKILEDELITERFMFVMRLEVSLTRTNPTIVDEFVRCERIKNKDVGRFTSSVINKTHFINPKYIQDEKGIHVIADYYTAGISKCNLGFIKTPHPILSTSSDYTGVYGSGAMSLQSFVHQEIVDIAVRQALQVLQDPRWQSSVQEQQIKTD